MRLPKNSTATLFVNCNQLLDGANELDFKSYEAVEKVGLGADLFAVTIPCCANQRGRR